MLDGVQDAFVQIFSGLSTFKDGTLERTTMVDNGKGTLTKTTSPPVTIKVQVDAFTQAQRPEGWAEDDVRLIILAGATVPDGRLLDDDMVTVGGGRYAIAGPSLDPLSSHWICRGRRKP